MDSISTQRADRSAYFEMVSAILRRQRVAVEVLSSTLGDQIAEEGSAIDGLAYEPRTDTLHLYAGLYHHAVPHPREVFADSAGPGLKLIAIKDGAGQPQIIYFRAPRLLEAS